MLSGKGAWELINLFDIVCASLRARDYARCGNEMLRVRAEEKLQNFLSAGIVTKTGREYPGRPEGVEIILQGCGGIQCQIRVWNPLPRSFEEPRPQASLP